MTPKSAPAAGVPAQHAGGTTGRRDPVPGSGPAHDLGGPVPRDGECSPGGTEPRLGEHLKRQLAELCEAAGTAGDAARSLLDTAAGPLTRFSLLDPPPARSLVSDDHSPAEFSLAFTPGAPPVPRVLLEPGYTDDMARSGRVGRRVAERLAERGVLSCDRLSLLADLFFPAAPHGPFAMWLALEFPAGRPRAKVYLNPAANGPGRSADTVAEALARLGYGDAFPALRRYSDGFLFFALDLGDWPAPRVKVYATHREFSAAEAAAVSRAVPGDHPGRVEEFVDLVAAGRRLRRRPLVSCFSFTRAFPDRPSGYSLHVPVRDYVNDDHQARDRAVAALHRHGIDGRPLDRALAGMTSRPLDAGVGLIAYLTLTHADRCPPRVTVYLSSEAYGVKPPRRNAAGLGEPGPTMVGG
ncbi:tryptophan dimethylallyltransferase family protein [Actinomadura sp. 7K534]|uniref:tryptophan dimethylallyltransferase family protein n=1 Tax=Actinomadura sp. 7K534 TaxID=2530366 RepID=UPI0010528056|nr:tryptophan dimethylallyltransferase family protein [Actinomadura sp. 7K534]TDB97994.1 prenyltransferase [Actinomadura sp. 7K534]